MVGEHRLEVWPSGPLVAFSTAFLLGGLVIGGLAGMRLYDHLSLPHSVSSWIALLPISLAGFAFAAGGLYFLGRSITPAVFDRERFLFWNGRSCLRQSCRSHDHAEIVELKQLHAVQVLAKYKRDDASGDYYHYQVNLVLEDGRRVLAFGHGGLRQLWRQVEDLTQFLHVPLWGIAKARVDGKSVIER